MDAATNAMLCFCGVSKNMQTTSTNFPFAEVKHFFVASDVSNQVRGEVKREENAQQKYAREANVVCDNNVSICKPNLQWNDLVETFLQH